MYILPGFTSYQEKNNTIIVKSEIYQSEVEISDIEMKNEFREIAQNGCTALSTPMTKILHEQKLLADKLFEHILTYISDQCIKYNHVIISWFGGEPTLCADNVLKAASLIQELHKKYSFRYQSDMTTNGYALNEKLFCKLYKAGVTQYQVTIDGKNHDKTRPHVSGKGTLNVIMKNISSISHLPSNMNFEITIRHNILSGDEDFEWYDDLAKIIGDDNRFSILVRPVGDWGGDSVKKLNICSESEQGELVKRHIAYIPHTKYIMTAFK